MPRREWRLRVGDVLEAIERVLRYTDGMTFDDFKADERTVDAVLRNFTVIGEAAGHIPADIEDRHPDVPWVEMRGIRNVVVHEYFGVSMSILWETVVRDLPPIVDPLRAMLKNKSESESKSS